LAQQGLPGPQGARGLWGQAVQRDRLVASVPLVRAGLLVPAVGLVLPGHQDPAAIQAPRVLPALLDCQEVQEGWELQGPLVHLACRVQRGSKEAGELVGPLEPWVHPVKQA